MQSRPAGKQTEFLNHLRVTLYKDHEVLLFQGEVPKEAYVIKKGVVKTYNLSESGEEQLIELNTAGDVLPLPWVAIIIGGR